MDPATHLGKARDYLNRCVEMASQGHYAEAGELAWGAEVQAVSAADPEHGQPDQDRFRNPHHTPNTYQAFIEATRRIPSRPLSESEIIDCAVNGQKLLHNHFYHLDLPEDNLPHRVARAVRYAQVLIASGTNNQSKHRHS